MGRALARRRLRHGNLARLARALGKSARTLCNWRGREGRSARPGRKPHSEEAQRSALEACRRVWTSLPSGHNGWRSVSAALERDGVLVATRLVQHSVRALKHGRKKRERARIEERRTQVEVHYRDALWSLDQTHLGTSEPCSTRSLLVRECFVPRTLAIWIGGPAEGRDVVALLQRAAYERGGWPLVLQMDNGPENRNALVMACLADAQVVALWNEPRTPEHNARVERSIGSLKRASGLGRAARRRAVPSLARERARAVPRTSLCVRLLRAWRDLDERTPRLELDGMTPAEIDSLAPRAEDHVRRARFYADVNAELDRIAQAPECARARRKLSREAIWQALERHGLVTRTRGGLPVPTGKAEGIS